MDAKIEISNEFKRPKIILTLKELQPYFTPKPLSYKNSLVFQSTLFFSKSMTYGYSNPVIENPSWNPYDEILDRIYLGRVLETGSNPLPDDVGLVISVITYGELAGLVYPFEEHCAKGGKHVYIHMEDFSSEVSEAAVINAIHEVQEFLEKSDLKIYIHCKAGASRSAVFLAMYHVITNNIPLDAAIDFLKSKRNQVVIDKGKRQMATSIINLANELDTQVTEDCPSHCMASLEAKTMICQLPSFKRLAIYAAQYSTTRAQYLRNYLQTILSSEDGQYYLNMRDSGCELMRFLNRQPSTGPDDKPLREQLVGDFEQELKQLDSFLNPFYCNIDVNSESDVPFNNQMV